MAKKRNGKIKLGLTRPDNRDVVQLSESGLPAYHHFVDSPDQSFRVFFELPKSDSEIQDSYRPNKKFLRKPSGHNPFRIMVEGKDLVGEDIAKTFAVLLSKLVINNAITQVKNPCSKEHNAIRLFFKYLSDLDQTPTKFSKITLMHLAGWLTQSNLNSLSALKSGMKRLLNLHPTNQMDMTKIRRSQQVTKPKRFEEIDFDEIIKARDYSERVHFQFLAYAFFEIENANERLKALKQASPLVLGDEYIQPEELNTKNPIIRQLLESGEQGYKTLIYHLYFYLELASSEKRKNNILKQPYTASGFIKRIKQISMVLFKDSEKPNENFDKFKAYFDSSEPNNWPITQNASPQNYSYMNLTSKHHEIAIFLYALMTLGVNKEVALSWKQKINGKPWYENFDIELGISDKSAIRDKKIVLVGIKKKGRTPKVIKKSISLNSPLFKYLKLLDSTRPTDREYIFTLPSAPEFMTAFINYYPVIDDDGNRLKSIQTQRFRKSYLGYKTFSLLEGVINSDDLVSKLQESLNHKSFDTTFSSYIMKSGMARTVIDSAIVALTTNMIESAVTFKGEIKHDNEHSKDNETVYLCDCSDPSNPSHGLPINKKCYKYEMCLGCERSEVYSEHLPAICYRIMQYENKQEEAPDVFKITLEDRMYIAKDTIEQFKMKHCEGKEIVEQAYMIANQAMLDNDPLLPDILQTGAL